MAKNPRREHLQRTARRWTGLGAILAVVVPVLGAASLVQALRNDGHALDATSVLLLIGVIALAAVCHGSIIFGGAAGSDAMARLTYSAHTASLARDTRRAGRAAQEAQDTAGDAFRAYAMELDRYRELHGDPPDQLRIQARDADLINTAVGDRVIATPGGGASGDDDVAGPAGAPTRGPAGPDQPAAAAADAASEGDAAEAEYLRTVLEARQRNADGEVQPEISNANGGSNR